jgi:hypothetical protein
MEFRSQKDARAFIVGPSLREGMKRAGVGGEPDIHFRAQVEAVE